MNNIEIFLIAFSLSADTFVISVASGSKLKVNFLINTLKMAIIFAFFQGAMPVLGWFAGNFLEYFFSGFAQWIAFFLLLAIGGKMIFESFAKGDKSEENPFNFFIVLLLALATSIDALAIGISFCCLNIAVVYPAIIIAVVTFIAALLGLYVGHKMVHFFENKIEFIGRTVLILIGFKIILNS